MVNIPSIPPQYLCIQVEVVYFQFISDMGHVENMTLYFMKSTIPEVKTADGGGGPKRQWIILSKDVVLIIIRSICNYLQVNGVLMVRCAFR